MSTKYNVNRDSHIKDFWYTYCTIISSTDNPFAISDTFREYLPETKESLLIVAPYVSKSFIDMIRTLLKGIMIKFLTRIPNEKSYWASRAIESLTQIARSSGLKLDIRCKRNLHAKFIVIDNEIVLSGSVNPTSSGMYDNDEIIYVFQNPKDVKRHIEIFDTLWNCPKNTTWEKVQLFSGYKGYDSRYSLHEKIAEKIVGFFYLNHNQPINKGVLVRKMEHEGYEREDIVEVIRNLLYSSPAVLWEPNKKTNMLRLVNYQTNFHDF